METYTGAAMRYHMDNGAVMVEVPDTPAGRNSLVLIRRRDARFRRRRIKRILQAHPKLIKPLYIYEVGHKPGHEVLAFPDND